MRFEGPAPRGEEGLNTCGRVFRNQSDWRPNFESLTDKFGKFSAQPFERGWGTTVGNSLRRALLSSIEGAAITAVKIEACSTNSPSIPGVVEDATDIILNLKAGPAEAQQRSGENHLRPT